MISSVVTVDSDEANGTFTDWMVPPTNPHNTNFGTLLLVVEGSSWDATITVQVSTDEGDTAIDTEHTFTSNFVGTIFLPVIGGMVRAGAKNGDFLSGSVDIGIYK